MQARILNTPPLSGTIDEIQYDAIGNCTWVEFSTLSNVWVGIFGKGKIAENRNAVTLLNNEKNAFVIAGVQGYVINLEMRSLVYKTSDDYLQYVIAVPEKDLVLACDHTNLMLYNSERKIWESDRIALDGIKLTESFSTKVLGYIWQIDGWYSFILDVDKREIINQKFLSGEWDFLENE